MKRSTPLILYLLLNVLVSACTTLGVLVLWERSHNTLPDNLVDSLKNTYLGQSTDETPYPQAKATALPQPTPTEAFFIHQVVSGETFESLAEEYDMSVEELVAINGFTQSQPLGEGEVLRIPVHPQGVVVIDSVIGAGDLETEKVLLKHRGEGELTLVGWRLENQKGGVFIFPQVPELTLFKNGAVYIHSKAGADTVVDLYWGLKSPVWNSGDTITLRDSAGNVRSTYTIP